MDKNISIICLCGCGNSFPKYDSRRRERKFIYGHHQKTIRSKSGRIVDCSVCGKEIYKIPSSKKKIYFCSYKCYWKNMNGVPRGKRKKPECKECGKELSTLKPNTGLCFECWVKGNIGENHPIWKGDKCKKRDERNDSIYQNWVNRIKRRDKFTCKINNESCSGYCEVHHILSWKDYPELRYNVNNGITLCQAHHPRKRAEEKRLIPFFQELVSVSNGLF